MNPTWLTEMHRQWHKARGKKLGTPSRPFSRVWHDLLDETGITSAEDMKTAGRELEAMEKDGRLKIKYYKHRSIEKVILPVGNEPWWIALFGGRPTMELAEESLSVVKVFYEKDHPLFPDNWKSLLAELCIAFTAGRNSNPFKWTEPESLEEILEIAWKLTAREWEPGTLVRDASIKIGLDSKGLERRQASIESAFSLLFGEKFEFKNLGLAEGDTHVELSGIFQLHFSDGSSQKIDNLRIAKIDTSDIFRCVSISTEATELLTIENRKTTFRQYAEDNRDALIATTSFPTPTFREFLKKLPQHITHLHFGDTDPAGWHILLKLREATERPVEAFRMKWRPGKCSNPLSAYDQKILPKLLSNDLLADVHEEIAAIQTHNDKGNYEQETLSGVL